MLRRAALWRTSETVSVLFNEPKLLKWQRRRMISSTTSCFSALQRAEIAEIETVVQLLAKALEVSVLFNEPKLLKFELRSGGKRKRCVFQCSSTSRNC